MASKVVERFLGYIKVDTRADENSTTFPSTLKQKNLGKILYQELKDLGVSDVYFDEEFGYVYGKLSAFFGFQKFRKTATIIAVHLQGKRCFFLGKIG